MSNETLNTNVEVATTVPVVATPKTMTLQEGAEKIVSQVDFLAIRPTKSTTYRVMGSKENADLNFKKGLFFSLKNYAKGFVLNLELYSTKKSAHLAQFNDKMRAFAKENIKCSAEGFAVRLHTNLAFADGEEKMIAQAVAFINLLEPAINECRAALKDEDFVSKKESKAVAPEAAAPAAEAPVIPEEPKAETQPEAPAAEATVVEETPAAAPVIVTKAAKKNGKRK
jgi:hypothetical protein